MFIHVREEAAYRDCWCRIRRDQARADAREGGCRDHAGGSSQFPPVPAIIGILP